MSTEMPIGLTLVEKIFGIVLVIIGATFTSASLAPPAGDITHFSNIFVIVGLIIAGIGLLLLISKTE
ncbi:hypothetical protein ACFLRN_08235 [Thermoproteota archaeon]